MSEPSDDRPAALLTQAQREYLRGEKDYRPAAERGVRSRIRERARGALFDLQLLFESLDEEDLRKVFQPPEGGDSGDVATAIENTLGLLYLGSLELEGAPFAADFEQMLEIGMGRAERQRPGDHHRWPDVDISWQDPTNVDFDAMKEKIAKEHFTELSEMEAKAFIKYLTAAEEVDPEDIAETAERGLEQTSFMLSAESNDDTDEE